MASRPSPSGAVATCLLLLSVACGAASLAWAVLLRQRLEALQANNVGDPERLYIDECMRDFYGTTSQGAAYFARHRNCVEEIARSTRFGQLPRVRLAVDERLCEPEILCRAGDPPGCRDVGRFGETGYSPGDVTRCYDLIGKAKVEQSVRARSELLIEIEQRCRAVDRWRGYANKVHLDYCMWKHQSGGGVCANSLRTNCPKDGSCCPTAQNHIGDTAAEFPPRPDQYVCRKSPSVGLYCQHVSDQAPGNSSGPELSLCTEVSCGSFGWCLDLADVPGLCLGKACQSFRQALVYAAVLAALAVLGLLGDLVDAGLLIWHHTATAIKSTVAAAFGFLKLASAMLCLMSGVRAFLDTAVDKACFNQEGNAAVAQAHAAVGSYLIAALLSAGWSLCLAPISARRVIDPMGLPYSRVKVHT